MKRILLLFIALAAVWGAAAKIRLPEIVGNDMVLQQNAGESRDLVGRRSRREK